MSTKSKTICDMCGVVKPTDYGAQKGWVSTTVTGAPTNELFKDYCPPCWKPVGRILMRSFVDGLLLEAQGVVEEKEPI